MIERYIYDVTRRLPEKERDDVSRELEANIADMLTDNPTEQDVIDALTKLGSPRELAEQYRQKPRYLISPAMFDMYISVMKMAAAIVGCVCACLGFLLELISMTYSDLIWDILGSAIGLGIEGALQAAFWVTVGFVIAEYKGVKQKPWTVGDLPHIPDQKGVKISRSSTIVGMGLTVFFTSLVIAMIVRGEWVFVAVRGSEIINPLSLSAQDRLIPFIIILGCLALTISGLKLYWAKWNLPLCAANAVYNIAWVSIIVYILHWPDLISREFIDYFYAFMEKHGIDNFTVIGITSNAFSALLILIACIDTGTAIWNTLKGMSRPKQAV